MGWAKGPPKNRKENFKKCQDFFFVCVPIVQSVQTDRDLLLWFQVFFKPSEIL